MKKLIITIIKYYFDKGTELDELTDHEIIEAYCTYSNLTMVDYHSCIELHDFLQNQTKNENKIRNRR
jgi:hypothetical protein